jgi:hypothetical protein
VLNYGIWLFGLTSVGDIPCNTLQNKLKSVIKVEVFEVVDCLSVLTILTGLMGLTARLLAIP